MTPWRILNETCFIVVASVLTCLFTTLVVLVAWSAWCVTAEALSFAIWAADRRREARIAAKLKEPTT